MIVIIFKIILYFPAISKASVAKLIMLANLRPAEISGGRLIEVASSSLSSTSVSTHHVAAVIGVLTLRVVSTCRS
jgi:hypothetical protein